jgi:hypothetical protein
LPLAKPGLKTADKMKTDLQNDRPTERAVERGFIDFSARVVRAVAALVGFLLVSPVYCFYRIRTVVIGNRKV